MRNDRDGFLSEFLSQRRTFVELLLTALFIALGTNLISDSLPRLLGLSDYWVVTLGFFLCMLPLSYLAARFWSERNKNRSFYGLITYDDSRSAIVKAPRYEFVNNIGTYLEITFFYHKDLENSWKNPSLYDLLKDDQRESLELVLESIQYFVLRELAEHLRKYFAREIDEDLKRDEKKRRFKQISKEEIANILDNNVMRSIAVSPTALGIAPTPGIQIKTNQASRIKLVVPREGTIKKFGLRGFSIDTDVFTVNIEPSFVGFDATLPSSFYKNYLSLSNIDRVKSFNFSVDAKVTFKFKMLWKGLKYYQWIDSFFERLDQKVSQKTFFTSIGLDSALTTIEYIEPSLNRLRQNGNA